MQPFFLHLIGKRFIRLTKSLAHAESSSEKKLFGLGQFVLLLSLTPFLFDLSLYQLSDTTETPAHYEIKPDRFESLPPYPGLSKPPSLPKAPQQLTKDEQKLLNICNSTKYVKYLAIAGWIAHDKVCPPLVRKNAAHSKNLPKYIIALANYNKALIEYRAEVIKSKQSETAYQNFNPVLTSKPAPSPEEIIVKKYSNRALTAMVNSTLAVNTWQHITTPIWFIGLILILPTIWLTIRRRYWGLLLFGLGIPTFNYAVLMLSFIPSLDAIGAWQIHSAIAAQIAFLWFAMRGKLQSRSFALYILLITLFSIWPILFSNLDYPAIQSLLPILVFMMAAVLARLIVKGILENAYLFNKLGWINNVRKSLHTLWLWMPLGLLAVPFFYVTEALIPHHTVNQLHAADVLNFGADHDILDNALISTATKADDIAFSWHLSAETTKRDIYNKATQWENIKLSEKMIETFDQIMPESLVFEDVNTDVPLIGWAIDIGVKESQKSTNKAYKNLRKNILSKLIAITEKYDQEFKASINRSKTEALQIVDSAHQKGLGIILDANEQAQNTLWWTINYMQTMHQLTIFVFAFVCLKSLLYVFARVSFNQNTGTFVTLGNTESTHQQAPSTIMPTGHQYLIADNHNQHYYISRRYQCRGKAPRFSIPQPFRAPIARFFHGSYAMNKIIIKQGDGNVSCTATQGMEFFEWSLDEDESVIFDFHHFVGMSESIELSTLISMRASSLLLGKMIYSQATGPGKLILMAKGRAEVIEADSKTASLPPERLIAMQKDTRFYIDSEIDVVNIYLSTAYISPAGGGQVIVDVDSQRGNKTGLGSFVRRFILPW
ncbi:MAG: hypothetical protein ACMZ63_02230 [Methylotenera sp.]